MSSEIQAKRYQQRTRALESIKDKMLASQRFREQNDPERHVPQNQGNTKCNGTNT